MNVIVANKNKDLLSGLDIDVIKSLTGEFTVEELIQQFSNFFYNKMFLDITAIKNYADLKELQKLSIGLDISKTIFLLDNSEIANSPGYISKMISMGIYNFSQTFDGLSYLYLHPNTYKDVAHLQQLDPVINQVVQDNNNQDVGAMQEETSMRKAYILGVKNITTHAGATTLIYLLKQQLSSYCSVVAVEVNRRDFIFFNDKDMISIRNAELEKTINDNLDKSIILLDLNDSDYASKCSDILYLMEPSTLKLNKMITINQGIFAELNGKKIVLNKSLLNNKDLDDFQKESNSEVFYSLPPLNDKVNNADVLLPLLDKLGLINNNN